MEFFSEAKNAFESFATGLKNEIATVEEKVQDEIHSHTSLGQECHQLHPFTRDQRYHSFAPERHGNEAKWFVDGCGYMWAVSVAIEEAKESIWILDWWLSPELYLRRPPSQNENYRIDRMFLAAAQRGVKVNVIVYKEVAAVLTLCSEHTKHALELHPNIAVFRHPDHTPSGQVIESEILSSIKNFSLKSLQLAQVPIDAFKALYGASGDVILYWAHHEKLCLIDGKTAFMGGLDLCFGRWDTNSHPLADAHPGNIDQILFPGQDFNNARIYDFEDVTHWDQNKLDRTKNSRMGWSDLSMCLKGPVVEDLRAHFVQRWNYIWAEKYDVRKDKRYRPLTLKVQDIPDGYYHENGKNVKRVLPDREEGDPYAESEGKFGNRVEGRVGRAWDSFHGAISRHSTFGKEINPDEETGGMSVQLVRSCTRWSNGVSTEHSIANAYIDIITNSQHFIYIENQFFITATSDSQRPVRNKIGAAIASRIIRAFQNGEKYKAIICMPAVPAFAGDLHADDSLGTRAIMQYQYNSICRGGHSIIETIKEAGVQNPEEYIGFYNLRNYDRINAGGEMKKVEKEAGVSYEDARKEHDDVVGAGYDGRGEGTGAYWGRENPQYESFQDAGKKEGGKGQWDSVSACYMDGGPDIRSVPWEGSPAEEMDAFVSEELYIHSKILIADDRICIIGSANLNDRSQLGYHDSEIAVVVEDPTPIQSTMNHQPYTASSFASSLRRQLFRKHLGLLPYQDFKTPDLNFLPIGKGLNKYDWNSPSDILVRDPLSREFHNLWNGTAQANTEVFEKAFHIVPTDRVRNWKQYETWFQNLYIPKKDAKAKYEYHHVAKEEFPNGVQELKEQLARVRGTLVQMPLRFMDGVDFAEEGLKLNALTDEVYT